MKPLAVVIAFVGLLSLFWWASRNQGTRRQRIRWTIVVGTAMLLGALGVVLFPRSAALLIVLGLIGLVGIGVIASLLYLAWLVIVSLNRRKYAERRDLALSQDWYRELKEGITGATRDRVVELEALGFQRTLDFVRTTRRKVRFLSANGDLSMPRYLNRHLERAPVQESSSPSSRLTLQTMLDWCAPARMGSHLLPPICCFRSFRRQRPMSYCATMNEPSLG